MHQTKREGVLPACEGASLNRSPLARLSKDDIGKYERALPDRVPDVHLFSGHLEDHVPPLLLVLDLGESDPYKAKTL